VIVASLLFSLFRTNIFIFQLRHKTILPPGLLSGSVASANSKITGLPIGTIKNYVESDFNDGRYYITGDLTEEIYADNCVFDGPDPDMPVVGLRKFLASARGLFDEGRSSVILKDVQVVEGTVRAKWSGKFVLRLPWRPEIREINGITNYELDEDGLICRHTEMWEDITVWEAFWGAVVGGKSTWL